MAKIKNKPEKVYLGLTEGPWKQRNYGHKFSFSNKKICTQYSTFEICMGL